MFNWFRKGPSPYQTALAMIGAKPGNRVLVAGAADPELAAELARITGLNGTTLVVDSAPDAGPRVESAAAHAGALLEFEATPLTALAPRETAWDLVVIPKLTGIPASDRPRVIGQMFRTLRTGGRIVIINGAVRSTALGTLKNRETLVPSEEILATLRQAGGKAVRLLATAERVSYFEAQKGA